MRRKPKTRVDRAAALLNQLPMKVLPNGAKGYLCPDCGGTGRVGLAMCDTCDDEHLYWPQVVPR